MVATLKFSQFVQANLATTTNKLVGIDSLSGGQNIYTSLYNTWNIAGRPSPPSVGMYGYNTDLLSIESYNGTTWVPTGSGGTGSVVQVNTGTGLTGGPITTIGTISFAAIAAFSLWANNTASAAVPSVIPMSTFLQASNNLSDLTNTSSARMNLGLVIGSNVQAWSPILDQISMGTWTGSTAITTLGTITTGTWQATPIDMQYGGTGTSLMPIPNAVFSTNGMSVAQLSSTLPSGLTIPGYATTGDLANYLPLAGGTMSGAINMGGFGITSLLDPVNPQDAATKAYVDSTASGFVTSISGTVDRITSTGGTMPVIDIAATYIGQSSITTLGTITTGTWNGTAIDLASYVSGNLSVNHLNSGTGASNTTFWRGDGTWTVAGSGTVSNGTANQLAYYATTGTTISGLSTANNGVLVTDGSGVPSISSTLPTGLTIPGYLPLTGGTLTGALTLPQLNLPTTTSSSSGIIYQNGQIFIHSYGTSGNTFVGQNSGNLTNTGSNNSGIGAASLVTLSTGSSNSAMGLFALSSLTSGDFNDGFGGSTGGSLSTGSRNLFLGYATGSNYTGSESNNILIKNFGVMGESNIGRIGTTGSGSNQITDLYLAGIVHADTGLTIANKTFSIGGNTTFSGSFTFTGTLTANTSVTFPTSGTLATTSQLPTPAALTKTDDTNVTLTLGGTPTTALLQATSLTLGWTGTLSETRGGTAQSTYTLGDTLYSSASNTLSKLSGNTTTTKQYLSQTGNGTISAAPVWATIAGSDITGAALTKTDDTNVTLTLGGTPTTALLRAASITAGWTGQLALSRGGTNANLTASNGGLVYSTGSAMAILAGTATAGQIPRSGANSAPSWSTTTYPATDAINTIRYFSSANVADNIATANNAVLQTNSSGVPSMSTTQTYTPTLGDGTNNFTTSTASGWYYRVGARTFVNINIIWTGKGSASGALRISLPGTSAAAPGSNCFSMGFLNGISSSTGAPLAFTNGGDNYIQLITFVNAGSAIGLTVANVNTSGQFQLSGWYGS